MNNITIPAIGTEVIAHAGNNSGYSQSSYVGTVDKVFSESEFLLKLETGYRRLSTVKLSSIELR